MNKEQYKSFRKHWITSDIHFNHLNIVRYNPETRGQFVTGKFDEFGYPIPDMDWMNETIVERWNSQVQPEDHTFIIGDVSMGDVSKAPGFLRRMNGAKTLIMGNHDRSLMKLGVHRELFLSTRDYLAFSPEKGTELVMFHFPIAHWDHAHKGAIHFHGHLHGSPSGLKGRLMDVGMDTNNLYPYDLEAVIRKMKEIPKPTHDHHGDTQ